MKRGGTLNEEAVEYLKTTPRGAIPNNNVGSDWFEVNKHHLGSKELINNKKLSRALADKQQFTLQELVDFDIEYAINPNSYIKSGDKFFSPKPVKPTRLISNKEAERIQAEIEAATMKIERTSPSVPKRTTGQKELQTEKEQLTARNNELDETIRILNIKLKEKGRNTSGGKKKQRKSKKSKRRKSKRRN